MRRLAIVHGGGCDYIREVLSLFRVREARRGGGRTYLAVDWEAAQKGGPAASINERFEVAEEPADRPPLFEEAVLLDLPASAEKALHRKISAFLRERGVSLLNPDSASRRAGDKFMTTTNLAAKGIPVPEALLLTASDRAAVGSRLAAFLARHGGAGFYVQPNEGTEGRETHYFPSDEFRRAPERAVEAVAGILRDRAAIVRKARGNVFYFSREEAERGYRQVIFRVFLWQPDEEVEADLGFAELAPSGDEPVSSPESGGRIVPTAEALARLFYQGQEGFRRVVLTQEEERSLPAAAVRALAAFNARLKQKLRVAGVDLLLEVRDGGVQPIVLEINPRPSGLDKLAPLRGASGLTNPSPI